MADELNQSIMTPVDIESEMKKSYLDYAMSVIIGRALPDVRDGLIHSRAARPGNDSELPEVARGNCYRSVGRRFLADSFLPGLGAFRGGDYSDRRDLFDPEAAAKHARLPREWRRRTGKR